MPNAKIHENIPVARFAPPVAPGEAPAMRVTAEHVVGMQEKTSDRIQKNLQPEKREAPGAIMRFIHREVFDRILGPSIRYYHHSSLNSIDRAQREKDIAREFNALPEVVSMRQTAKTVASLSHRYSDPLLRDLMKACTAYDHAVNAKIKECWGEIIYNKDEKDPFYVPYIKKMGGHMTSILHKHLCGKTVNKSYRYGSSILRRKTEIRYHPVTPLFASVFKQAIQRYSKSGDVRLQSLAQDLRHTLDLHGTVSMTNEDKELSDKEAIVICAERSSEAKSMIAVRKLLPLRNRRHRKEDPEAIAYARAAADEYFAAIEKRARMYVAFLRKTHPYDHNAIQEKIAHLFTKDNGDLRLMLRGEGRWKNLESLGVVFESPTFTKAFQKLATHCKRFPHDQQMRRLLNMLHAAKSTHTRIPVGRLEKV